MGGGATRGERLVTTEAQTAPLNIWLSGDKKKKKKHFELHLGHSHKIKQRAWESLTQGWVVDRERGEQSEVKDREESWKKGRSPVTSREHDKKKEKKEWRAVCELTDTAMGNQWQPLNESAAADELSHSGRYLLNCCSATFYSDTWITAATDISSFNSSL